jgi:SAM-dependent methyltransferase
LNQVTRQNELFFKDYSLMLNNAIGQSSKNNSSGSELYMEKIREGAGSAAKKTKSVRQVLNAGSGPYAARKLHSVFLRNVWQEVRIDIDPQARPDIVSSITDMKSSCKPQSFDAIWSSHTLEHLYAHEVPLALAEFNRVLKPDGFALVTSPDLEAVASLLIKRGLDHVAYTSPAGPITPLDMLFGHSASIAEGHYYMSHKTGFTCAALGAIFIDAGFATAVVKREGLDLWALGLMPEADQASIQRELVVAGLDLFEQERVSI